MGDKLPEYRRFESFSRQMDKWIKCAERLPEEYRNVLTYIDGQYVVNFIVNCPEPLWACTKPRDSEKIKYWMELPEKPE